MLPIAVISRVLGLPDADLDTLDRAKGWMEAVLAWRHSYGEDAEARAAAIDATRQLEPLLLDTVRARRDRPEDDGISLLWHAGREVAPDWAEQDVVDNAKFMYEAASETTAFLICNATYRLLELTGNGSGDDTGRPRHVRLVPGGGPASLHGHPCPGPSRHHGRGAGRGAGSKAGERVFAVNAAANRDPQRWERPADIDPSRPRLFGHLAFNVGPRHCAGSHLARLEATEVIRGMFRALPDLAPTGGVMDAIPLGFVTRAWRPIPLTFSPMDGDVARARVNAAPAGALPDSVRHGGYAGER